MKKVLFVGDQPTDDCTHYAVPFAGAKCFKRLVEWIKAIEPDYYEVINQSDYRCPTITTSLYKDGFRVIALGNEASAVVGEQLGIPHLKLPHPSGRNRQLNDKKLIKKMLDQAKEYVHG